MECCSSLNLFPISRRTIISGANSCRSRTQTRACISSDISGLSYQKFIHFAVQETKRHTNLHPSPLQEKYSSLKAMDQKTELKMISFQASKIRLLRSLYIEGSGGMQVLDFAVFPEPEFDLPIFCANFFSNANMNIVVLDLNPLYDVICYKDYQEKYYKNLLPLGLKYAKLLPWGGKITGESLRFFSPMVIWTKFPPSQEKHKLLYSAFVDYYEAWLQLMDKAVADTDDSRTIDNQEAQHRYLMWRAEKDPGHRVLTRLIGETLAQDLLRSFLFNGTKELGSKTFLDYFPEYKCADGTVNEKRSMIGRSFENRPWDHSGEFIGEYMSD